VGQFNAEPFIVSLLMFMFFTAAIISCFEDDRKRVGVMTSVNMAFLQYQAPGPQALSVAGNADINKVAMVGHLLVHPDAAGLLTQLAAGVTEANRPASLDQVVPFKEQIGSQLLSLAYAIRDNLDYSKFDVANIGQDAHDACMAIDVSEVDMTAKELLSLITKMKNLVDELLIRLDASGGNLPRGLERSLLCYDRFIGQHGRSKDLGKFYCFVLWDGHCCDSCGIVVGKCCPTKSQ
jgi:hypothetical protein